MPPSVHLSNRLCEELVSEADEFAPRETGGILLGRAAERAGIVVTELVGAGPGAKRTEERFVPDGPWQRVRVAERYEASGHSLEYLGDWHSHPAGDGPSELDRSTARNIASTDAARCAHPLFVIVTQVRGHWEIRAYRFGRRRFRRLAVLVT